MLTNRHYALAAQLQVHAQQHLVDRYWRFIASEMSQHTIASILSERDITTFDAAKDRVMEVIADWIKEGLIE